MCFSVAAEMCSPDVAFGSGAVQKNSARASRSWQQSSMSAATAGRRHLRPASWRPRQPHGGIVAQRRNVATSRSATVLLHAMGGRLHARSRRRRLGGRGAAT